MGLISLTWVFWHNLVKIHLVVTETLSFFMFCATVSTGRPGPSCSAKLQKKSKRPNAKIIVTQSWYNSIQRYFQFYTLLFLVRDAILTGQFLFNFKTTHCKDHFDTNLVKIH